MKHITRGIIRGFLSIVLVFSFLSIDPANSELRTPEVVQAQFADDVWRFISKALPSTSRNLSREAKGEIGEENMENALRVLGRNMDEVFEVERIYVKKGALNHGIDGLFHGIKRNRFNVVESKATTSTGILYEGILGNTSAGREMDTKWIRQSLTNAEGQAWRIVNNEAATAAEKRAAREILGTIEQVRGRTLRRSDRTLVITRLTGVDGLPGVGRSVHSNLATYFDTIIEVDRNGRIIPGGIYPGLRH